MVELTSLLDPFGVTLQWLAVDEHNNTGHKTGRCTPLCLLVKQTEAALSLGNLLVFYMIYKFNIMLKVESHGDFLFHGYRSLYNALPCMCHGHWKVLFHEVYFYFFARQWLDIFLQTILMQSVGLLLLVYYSSNRYCYGYCYLLLCPHFLCRYLKQFAAIQLLIYYV